MIKIDKPVGSAAATHRPISARSSAGVGAKFTIQGQSATSDAPILGAPMRIDGLFALQMVEGIDDQRHKKRRAGVAFGSTLITQLETLQQQLIEGSLSLGLLTQLEHKLGQRMPVLDPQLDEILDDIELRVAVELAKHQHAAARSTST